MTEATRRRQLAAARARRYRQRQKLGPGLRRITLTVDLFGQADRLISAGRLTEDQALDDDAVIAELQRDIDALR